MKRSRQINKFLLALQNGQVKMYGVLSEYRRRCVFKGDTPSLNLTKCFLKTALKLLF